ncbi:MAG: heme exporter protein CcmB [Alphaproteobacteria bacterium]|nr:heme exporter protein CcmB [Alphaproteobacteria bacterium]
MTPFIEIVTRDVRLALRQGGATMLVVAFFVLTVTLFPLGVGPEASVLRRIAPGVIWVSALLAAMLSLDRLFQVDFEDGSLDQLALAPLPLELVAAAKCLAHWLSTGLPLLVISPLLGILLNLSVEAYGTLLLAMAIGTPSLSLVGAIGAALTVGIRRGGVLLSLLVLPLYIPVLIFGVGAIDAALVGLGGNAHLLVLAAILLIALPLAPWAVAGALRLNLE